jgi:hypothetical protein
MASASKKHPAREEQPQQPKAASAALLQMSVQKGARYETQMARHAAAVKGELEAAVRRLRAEKARHVEIKRAKESGLVLPGLSVPDQVGELERIIMGLKEHALNADQLDIAYSELYGLRRLARGEGAAPGAPEGDLLRVRNEKLDEAIAVLESGMAANSGI